METELQRIKRQLEEAASQSTFQKTEYICETCQDTGWLEGERDGERGMVRCQCLRERIQRSKLQSISDEFPEFGDAKLKPFLARNSGQRDAHAIIASNPLDSFFLHSIYGRGKTYLLVAQFRHVVEAGIPALMRTSKQLVDELKRAEMDPLYTSKVLDAAANYQRFHLFWDDCEKAAARTDFRMEAIFDLIDTLYRRQLNLTITSNLPLLSEQANDANPCDLRFKLGNASVRRIKDMCKRIQL